MRINLDDLRARTPYDALAQSDGKVDAQSLIERLKRVELGLPIEDECILLLSWLGKCRLITQAGSIDFPKSVTEIPSSRFACRL
jgi:hypothetical protein